MNRCPTCRGDADDEDTGVLDSTDGPVLITRWRCRRDPTHWWTAVTDASPTRRRARPSIAVLRAYLGQLEARRRAA